MAADTGPLRYPYEALHATTDYLRVDLYDYDSTRKVGGLGVPVQGGRLNLTRNASAFIPTLVTTPQNYKKLESSIILPMPSNIQDGNSVDYADTSLDGLTAAVYNAVAANTKIGNGKLEDLSNALGQTVSAVGNVLISSEAKEYFTKSIAAQASNIPFSGNLSASQILARETGQILNPNMELLFNGVKLRSFRFSFKMTPRDEDEAKVIQRIIKTLKINMAPTVVSDVYLKTPTIFQLSYRKGNDLHPFLNLFKQCFLTDMSVNYTGEGLYATYSDGSPISYVMDLSFKELEPIYSNDYDKSVTPENSVGF